MIEVEMSKDIREYTPKIFWVLTKQQLKCYTIALAYGIPLFLFILSNMDITTRIMITAIAMAPVIACGYCPAYGMNLDQFFIMTLKNKLFTPIKRKHTSSSGYHLAYQSVKAKSNTKPAKYKKSKVYKAYK